MTRIRALYKTLSTEGPKFIRDTKFGKGREKTLPELLAKKEVKKKIGTVVKEKAQKGPKTGPKLTARKMTVALYLVSFEDICSLHDLL